MTLAEAQKKIMDLVANRDHGADELRQKLASRFEPDVIEQAVAWAQRQSWFVSPATLRNDIAEKLNRRGQSLAKINQKLSDMGLENIKLSSSDEYEKAKKIALQKWSAEDFDGLSSSESKKLKAQMARFLAGRGFESEIVFSVLKNELKAGADSHDEEY